jgi:hypothetical protein
MLYSFARVSAVLKLKVDDYYHNGARRRLRLGDGLCQRPQERGSVCDFRLKPPDCLQQCPMASLNVGCA